MAKYRVVVSDNRHDSYSIEQKILEQIDAELVVASCTDEASLMEACREADGILLDMAPMTAKVIEGLTKCRIINRYGVGYDNVDVEACTQHGIQLTNVPDYCAEDVSDHALALMLACLRDIARRDRLVRQGNWNIRRASYRLKGKVLGLLGFGRIARALVQKCKGFGFSEILVYDPYVSEQSCTSLGVKKSSLPEVLSWSDFISLHMPVTEETRGIINAETLALMKPSAILINTGRGPLIDDAALVSALQQNKILAAGLDTHNSEPLPSNSPYFYLDNVVLTDHTAYSTVEAVEELKTKSAQNIVRALTGKAPIYPVNKL